MDRRRFLQVATVGPVVAGISSSVSAAERYFPVKVDPALYADINRVKDPKKTTPLEKKHAPVINVTKSVKAGEPFIVEVSVGETVHDMGPTHWIEYIELSLGNDPAGRLDMQPKGYIRPKATFTVVVPQEAAPAGKITLIARQRCNLHGYWESSINITVV
jgi:superoxide reductase